jgi:hypothetical protein
LRGSDARIREETHGLSNACKWRCNPDLKTFGGAKTMFDPDNEAGAG